jgi:hypothetical protein
MLRWQAGKQQHQQQYLQSENFQWLLLLFTQELPKNWTEQVS